MDRRLGIAITIVTALLIAGGVYFWLDSRTVEAEFELRISATNGCNGSHPKYGTISGSVDLVLRDTNDKKLATVTMYDSALSNSLYCVMIGVGELPLEDVYRVQIDSVGTISDAGLVDRDEVESGSVLLINP